MASIKTFQSGLVLIIAMAMIITNMAMAESAGVDRKKPRVALVLSGGGALGLAHIGVLEVLEEMRVPIDCVVGTSMGALVGGAYAAGLSPEHMASVIEETDILELFNDEPPRADIAYNIKRDDYHPLFDFTLGFNHGQIQLPSGASAGYKFELFLKELIGVNASVSGLNFDDLPIPYRAIATDLETGDMMVFEEGDLPKVMRASMSLPAIISPTIVDDHIYVDGGLVRNLPIDIGRELCGDIIIAVNLGTKPKTRDQIQNSIDVAMQSIVILTDQNVKKSLRELTDQDILIVPQLQDFSSSDFDKKENIIQKGIEAALAQQAQLQSLAVSEEDYSTWLLSKTNRQPLPVRVTNITVATTGAVNAEAVRKDIHTEPGENFSIDLLNREITEIYGRGDFSYVGYSLIPEGDDNVILDVNSVSKPWGPGYLKFGLGAATDFNSPAQLNLAASYRRTWINHLGAEWRTDAQIGYDSFLYTEFMQPLQQRDGLFIAPRIGIRRYHIQLYEDVYRVGEVRIKEAIAGLDIGLTGSSGEIRLGPYSSRIRVEPDFGILTPFLPDADIRQNGLSLRAIFDQLDSANFPRSGVRAAMDIKVSRKAWHSEDEFTRAQIGLTGVKSFGKNTFAAHIEWGDDISDDGDLNIYENFKLGGPQRLAGLYLDQLTGSTYNLGTLTYYRQYATLPSQLGRGLYFGGSLQTGRINDQLMSAPWDWVTSGSLFWGADTILGAAYIGWGISNLDNQDTWYLVIGPRF